MKAKTFSQINIRVSPDMKERLIERAQSNFRSLNSEIERRLLESLEAEKGKAPNA